MLLTNIKYEQISENKNKFKIDSKSGWEFYCNSYAYALEVIFCELSYKNYCFNEKSLSLLFLIRHYTELVLKRYLYEQTGEILTTHNFSEIFHQIANKIDYKNKNYEKLKNIIIKSNFNICDDGSCYRYLENKNKRKYFDRSDRFNLYSFINDYNKLDFADCLFKVITIFPQIDNANTRVVEWNLTLETGSCNHLFQIATKYDFNIDLLVKKIIEGKINSTKIYLPLLFLIRHGIEINLKANLLKIKHMLSANNKRTIKNTHSIEKLYNIFTSCINNKILTKNTFDEISKKMTELKKLKEILHRLDAKSYAFRFPFDNNDKLYNLKIDGDELFKTVAFYWNLNSFMTFAIDWLIDIGELNTAEGYI